MPSGFLTPVLIYPPSAVPSCLISSCLLIICSPDYLPGSFYRVTPCLKIAISWKPASSDFYLAAGSNLQHIAKQFLCQFPLSYPRPCPRLKSIQLFLVACKLGITGNLYSRDRGGKGCAAAGCKEHHMGAGHSQGRSCHQVIAKGALKRFKPFTLTGSPYSSTPFTRAFRTSGCSLRTCPSRVEIPPFCLPGMDFHKMVWLWLVSNFKIIDQGLRSCSKVPELYSGS